MTLVAYIIASFRKPALICGSIGELISPRRRILSGLSIPTSGIGIAERMALVYGWAGWSNSSSVGAFHQLSQIHYSNLVSKVVHH